MVEEQTVKKPGSKLKLVLLTVFIVIAVTLIFLNRKGNIGKKPGEGSLMQSYPTPVVLTEGSFAIMKSASAQVGTNVKEVEIIASSNNKSIVAYDLVLSYERGSLEVTSVESLLPDFTVHPLERSDLFIITGVKKLESSTTQVFDNTPLLKLKIVPKKNQNLTIKVVEKSGKERSQMVDDKSNILNPDINELKLEIK